MELALRNKKNTFTKQNTFAGEVIHDAAVTHNDVVETSVGVGTAEDDIVCTEFGDGVNHVTELAFEDLAIGSAVGTASLGFGKLLYTLPAGAQLIEAVYMDLALTGTTDIVADTPDVGIGSVIASGAVAVLGGTGTFEDYLTGQTSGAIDGTNSIEAASGATAGVLTGIALNTSAKVKKLHLNVADGWADAGDVTATGTVVIVWKTLA